MSSRTTARNATRAKSGPLNPPQPERDCARCPRLAAFRAELRAREPDWFNAPVPSFGLVGAGLLIVGLAPGMGGANRTGRPFTGDYAGDLLYETLGRHGYTRGTYDRRPDDGLEPVGCRITNAVRCLPPQNKPVGAEIKACAGFLEGELAAGPAAVLALGRIAHETVLRVAGQKLRDFPFAHCARHALPDFRLYDSYHCSRYNTNTGRLTPQMFDDVFAAIRADD